jgi:hypothetical protein
MQLPIVLTMNLLLIGGSRIVSNERSASLDYHGNAIYDMVINLESVYPRVLKMLFGLIRSMVIHNGMMR